MLSLHTVHRRKARQGYSLHQARREPSPETLPALCSTSILQNCEKINFCCLRPPVLCSGSPGCCCPMCPPCHPSPPGPLRLRTSGKSPDETVPKPQCAHLGNGRVKREAGRSGTHGHNSSFPALSPWLKVELIKRAKCWEFRGGPVVRTVRYHQVRSLVWELRSCKPCSITKKKKPKTNKKKS